MPQENSHFHQEVPRRLQVGLLRAVCEGCGAAYDEAKAKHSDEWFHEAIYMARRLEVEKRLHDLMLPRGFRATVEKTPSTHYTRIESDAIVITAVTRSRRVSWVKPEPYRETMALPAQLDMFEAQAIPSATKRLHALLIYGGPPKQRLPKLARIVFPTTTGYFAPGSVELANLYPEVIAAYTPASAPTEVKVALRQIAKKKSE